MAQTVKTDVVVIGMGPGGEDVAGRLAEAGLDVVGVDAELVGGECPYWGCVPSKMMIRAANLLAEARRIPGVAGDSTVTPDWAPVARRIRDEATDDWDDRVAVERFEGKGGRFIRGVGRIVGPGRVTVHRRPDPQTGPAAYLGPGNASGPRSGGRTDPGLGAPGGAQAGQSGQSGQPGQAGPDGDAHEAVEVTARRGIVIATGTRAAIPPIPGLADTPYWTSRDAIAATELPDSLLVLGGGAVGVELAQAYARFGVQVSVVEALDRLAPNDEPEAGEILAEVFGAEGIAVRTGAKATEVAHDGKRFTVSLEDGEHLEATRLLVATGRRADLAAIGLGAVGVDESQRWVPVDERLRVTDGVWAVGDVTGKGAFTHVAVYQAPIAAAAILGEEHAPADYRALPRVTFTDPEIGSVGMTEAQAREAGIAVATGTAATSSSARGWIHKTGNKGLVKVVADTGRGVLVGATAMGPTGGEVLGLLTLAVHAEVPLDTLRRMIYAYPTFHRGVEDALRDLGT